MIRRRGRMKVGLMFAVAAVVTFHPTNTYECGGSWPDPVFVTQNPENADYPSGNLGIVRGSFSTQNLFIAYRTISGTPLSSAEAQAIATPLPNEDLWVNNYYRQDKNPYYEARIAIGGVPGVAVPNQIKDAGNYSYYLNCNADAFRAAVGTLRDRAAKYGKDSSELKDWISAQDQVFYNCDKKEPNIPKPLVGGSSAMAKADRDYQIAAANFYAENYDEAAELFRKIATDQSSQWHDWGLYLAARAYIRKATVKPDAGKPEESLKQAEELLRRAGAQSNVPEMKGRADSLIDFVEFRLDPKKRSEDLGRTLAKSAENAHFHQNVQDYLKLIPTSRGNNDEMADWIMMLHESRSEDLPVASESRDDGSNNEVVKRWRNEPKSLPWLIAALMKAEGKSGEASDLIHAGLSVAPKSPAYATARYNVARLLSEQGRRADARKLLDEYLQTAKGLPLASANLMLAVRTIDAASLEDFARFSAKKVAATNDYYMNPGDVLCTGDNTCPEVMWDNESAKTINHLPIKGLLELSKTSAAAERVRETAARLAFTRAMILNDNAELKFSAEALSKTKAYDKEMQRVIASRSAAERRTEAVLVVMGWPFTSYKIEPQIDFDRGTEEESYGGWWCGEGESNFFGDRNHLANPDADYPSFLSGTDRQTAEKQLKQLTQSQAAPDLFGEVVLGWSKQNPNDPRVPQALRRVVRAVHFACGGPKANTYAKEAFDRLHSKYPNSKEARLTRYWYKTRS